MARTIQIIALGGDRFHWPKRVIPARFVRHYLDGFNGCAYTGPHRFVTAVDVVTGDEWQNEVETDALMYYHRGVAFRRKVDSGQSTTVDGTWLRQNYELVSKGEGDFRGYERRAH